MKLRRHILLFLTLVSLACAAQKTLQVTSVRFGRVKIYELNIGDRFDYKLKGDLTYHKEEIVDLHDSLIFFPGNKAVKFAELKSIRIHKQQHLFHTIQTFFLGCGIGFFGLSALNNALLKNPPIISDRVSYISGGLVLTSFLIYEMGLRHLRINKHKTLKIVERNYQDLNVK